MSKFPGQSRTQARPAGGRIVGVGAAVATFAACVTGALAAGGDPPVGADPRFEPPTAAEAASWEREFLRSEGPATTRATVAKAGGRGHKRLFPKARVVSVYGAAGGFGLIGRKSVNGAARKVRRQARPYRKHGNKPVIPAFDLVAVIATQCSGRRDKCRTRVSDSTIQRYLNKAREFNGRLILDIQPARANVLDEIKHLRPFIRQPDVDVAIDAEWNIGPREEPGRDAGSISAKKLNKASGLIKDTIDNRKLPPKLLIVHQFHKGSVRNEKRIKRRDKVDFTLNFDGIGSPSAKKAGYRSLSSDRLFNGFSLFYKLDSNLMTPKQVLKLQPKPDYVMYQ